MELNWRFKCARNYCSLDWYASCGVSCGVMYHMVDLFIYVVSWQYHHFMCLSCILFEKILSSYDD